jgi:hypothetical protein
LAAAIEAAKNAGKSVDNDEDVIKARKAVE